MVLQLSIQILSLSSVITLEGNMMIMMKNINIIICLLLSVWLLTAKFYGSPLLLLRSSLGSGAGWGVVLGRGVDERCDYF